MDNTQLDKAIKVATREVLDGEASGCKRTGALRTEVIAILRPKLSSADLAKAKSRFLRVWARDPFEFRQDGDFVCLIGVAAAAAAEGDAVVSRGVRRGGVRSAKKRAAKKAPSAARRRGVAKKAKPATKKKRAAKKKAPAATKTQIIDRIDQILDRQFKDKEIRVNASKEEIRTVLSALEDVIVEQLVDQGADKFTITKVLTLELDRGDDPPTFSVKPLSRLKDVT